jgi:hypothetical protein
MGETNGGFFCVFSREIAKPALPIPRGGEKFSSAIGKEALGEQPMSPNRLMVRSAVDGLSWYDL